MSKSKKARKLAKKLGVPVIAVGPTRLPSQDLRGLPVFATPRTWADVCSARPLSEIVRDLDRRLSVIETKLKGD